MTYSIIHIIDFTLDKTSYTCELKITINEDVVYNGDNPIPDRKQYIESMQPIEITTNEPSNEPRKIIFPKTENKWLTLPIELRAKIEEKLERGDLSDDF